MSEASLQSAVLDLADTLGYYAHHCRPAINRSGKWSTPIQGDPGFPDLVLAHPSGAVVFLELKSKTGRLTEAQIRWGERLDRTNWVSGGSVRYGVVRPADLQRVAAMLTGARDRAQQERTV